MLDYVEHWRDLITRLVKPDSGFYAVVPVEDNGRFDCIRPSVPFDKAMKRAIALTPSGTMLVFFVGKGAFSKVQVVCLPLDGVNRPYITSLLTEGM